MKKASELPAVFHEYISLVESLVGEGLVTKKCPLDRSRVRKDQAQE